MDKIRCLFFTICFLLIACSKITQNNFDKVKPNMTMKEVVAILGEPTTTDSVNIAGVSGTSATWKNNKMEISIQFLNDQVAVKTLNSLKNNDKMN